MKTLIARLLLFGLLLGLAHEAKSATVLYAMTDNGRLYRSADGAKSWQNIALGVALSTALTQFQAFAVDPENSSNLYVDVSFKGRAQPGQQANYFFRSTDGGATWSQTTLPSAGTADLLAVDPASSNIIYAGLNGLSRSTDSGVTWSATSITTFVEGINPDAHHAGVVYVTTTDGKIYKSTDFGVTWTSLAGSLPPQFNRLLSVAADPNNGSVLWGAGEGSCLASNNIPFICGLVQSSDGGKTWQAISSVKGWFKNVVVDSRNGNIYAGGKDVTESDPLPALVVRSTDGGKTWAKITTGMSNYGVEVHLDPENAANLYGEQANLPGGADLGPGGGVYVSTDGGASWMLNPVDASQSVYDIVDAFAAVSSKTAAPGPPAISAVENGASFLPGIAANSWVTILGTNLATQTGDWSNAIVNGNLPTTLNGVSVSMGGIPAYIYYTSPGQLNVLAPNVTPGQSSVTVTTAGVTSSALPVTATQYGPAFFPWPGSQVVATRQDYSYAVKAGTFAGATTVAAKPGEVLILWGTGFGPTIPPAPSGVAVPGTGGYTTASAPTVSINNTPATVYGGALAPGAVGLYQIAIQVPTTLADGDWPIQASIGGATSPTGAILSVHQ